MIKAHPIYFSRKYLLLHGIILFLLLSPSSSRSQANFYTFSQSTETYTEITGGTTLGNASNAGDIVFVNPINPAGGNILKGPGFNIGFEFNYKGITYDRFAVSNFGWICLGRSIYGDTAVDIGSSVSNPIQDAGPANDTLRTRISAFGPYLSGNGMTSSLKYDVIGMTPNRTLVLQWKGYKIFPFVTNSSVMNFQIRINESDQSVDIRYGTCSFENFPISYPAQLGIGGWTPTEFSDRTTQTDWNSTVPGSTPSSQCNIYLDVIPPSEGLNFHWSTPDCVPPAQIVNDGYTLTSLHFHWTAPYTAPSEGYEYALNTSLTPPPSGSFTMLDSISFYGLTEGTQYYFHIRSLCSFTETSAWFTLPATTLCMPQAIPYLENFDGLTAPAMPDCMHLINEDPFSPTWSTTTSAVYVISAPNAALIVDSYSDARDWLFTPGLDLMQDSTYINIVDSGIDSLLVYVGDYPDTAHMMLLDTFPPGNSVYRQNYTLFTPDSTGTYYFAYKSPFGFAVIDNIECKKYDCILPDHLKLVTNTTGSITVTWNPSGSGALDYEFYADQDGTYPPVNTTTTSDTTASVSDLLPSTNTTFFVRTHCGAGLYSPWSSLQFITAVSNDECVTAIQLFPSVSTSCDSLVYGTTVGASPSGQPVGTCGGNADDDVWYKFGADSSSYNVTIYPECPGGYIEAPWPDYIACEAFTVEVYSDSCGGSFIGCQNFPAGATEGHLILTHLDTTKTYFIRLFGTDEFAGGSHFSICISYYPLPINDECISAIELLPSPENYCQNSYSSSTQFATASGQPVQSCGGIADDDVWFRFTATDRSHGIHLHQNCPHDELQEPLSSNASCEAYSIELYSDSCGGAFVNCMNIPAGTIEGIFNTTNLIAGKTYFIRVFETGVFIGGSNFDICVTTFPHAANDSCSMAEVVYSDSTVCINTWSGNLAETTASNIPSSSCPGAPYYDLWYKFEVIDTSQVIEVSFSDGADGVIEVLKGDCDSLISLGCSNMSSTGTEILNLSGLTIGDSLYVRLFDATGAGVYTHTEMCIRTPIVNDVCSGAINIPTVTGAAFGNPVFGNTYSANGTGSCNGYFADDDLWYRFTAEAETQIIMVVPYDLPVIEQPVIEFFGSSCDSSGVVCSNTGELILDSLMIGQEYFFRVYSAANGSGKGGFALSIVSPPENISCAAPDTLIASTTEECVLPISGSTIGAGLTNAVWYTFTAMQSAQLIRLTGDNGFYAQLSVYADCDSLPIFIGYYTGILFLTNLIPDNSYYIKVEGYKYGINYDQGTFSLCVSAPPVNDDCAGAITIVPSAECDTLHHCSTLNASASIISGSCFPTNNDIWYSFVATSTSHNLKMYPTNGSIFCRGELFQDSCGGPSLSCFENYPFQDYTTASFNNLIIGKTYFLRMMVNQPSNGYNGRGTFDFCLSTPPANDECSNPTVIQPNVLRRCDNPISGTTFHATNPSNGRKNVWYEFVAFGSSCAFQITPLTVGFDPAIRLWLQSETGGAQDQNCTVLNATGLPIVIDDTHADGQPEVLVVGGLTPFKTYLVEVYNGGTVDVSGDFELCQYNPGNSFKISSAEYQTYPFDSSAPAGKWHQAVTDITLRVSGIVNMPHLTDAIVNTNGSTHLSDILSVSLFYDAEAWEAKNQNGYKPFGLPGTDIFSSYATPIQLGQPSTQTSAPIHFTGDVQLTSYTYSANFPYKKNYTEHLYLVYDVNCTSTLGDILKGKCTSLTFDDQQFTPFEKSNQGLPISPLNSYDTMNDGAWEVGNTWVCGTPPPNNYTNPPTNINHLVNLNSTALCGDLSVKYQKALNLNQGSVLTLGSSSIGSLTGHSQKYFDCIDGSLSMNGATVNVNGKMQVGNTSYGSTGSWTAINSTLNIDGNDGTAAGSAPGLLFLIGTSNFVTDHFNINMLDPSYDPFFFDFLYNPNSITTNILHGTVRFGGGDDTTPEEDAGFTIRTYSSTGGILIPDSIIVNSGTLAQKRSVKSGGSFFACKNLIVQAGSEFIGRAAIQGNLINNGLMTIPDNSFLSFGGTVDLFNHFTNVANAQSISGTGFFRSGLSEPIPTSQSDNEINNLYLANTHGGLTLNMPLRVKNILRLRQGNIHTSASSLLTLGNEMNTGILVTNPFEPYLYYDTPFNGNVSNWDGGIVDGPMRRWFNGLTVGQESILPIGKDALRRPMSFHFANTPDGYITSEFIDSFPGLAGMPLIDEQAATITSAAYGYWRAIASGVNGTYTAKVNASNFTYDTYSPITDLSSVRLIKRPTNGIWVNSGSTTTLPPTTLNLVSAEGLSGFSDFGIGVNFCRIVTNGNDDGPGSLRYAIDQCSGPGDIIFIADYVDSIFLTSDTIIFDKNLTISCNGPEKVIISTTSSSPVFKVNANINITLHNIELRSGDFNTSRALINQGTLMLQEINIIKNHPGQIPVLNQGVIEISGNVHVKNQ